tara:strand:+ start:45 stop:383 length:339 start_codon:yes stop_codon:yes gene_type:complete
MNLEDVMSKRLILIPILVLVFLGLSGWSAIRIQMLETEIEGLNASELDYRRQLVYEVNLANWCVVEIARHYHGSSGGSPTLEKGSIYNENFSFDRCNEFLGYHSYKTSVVYR